MSTSDHIVGPLAAGLLDHAPIAMQLYRADGTCLTSNDAFVERFGVASPAHDVDALVRRGAAGEVIRRPDIVVQPVRDGDGAVAVVALWYPTSTADLAHALEASRRKSEFLANMSHELRTPLNGVLGFAQVLHDGLVPVDSPQHREFLGDILVAGRHLLRLINDLLDLAKVEAGRMVFHAEPCDVEALLHKTVAGQRADAAARGLTVRVEHEPGLGAVTVDPTRLAQIVENYLANAIKFTGAGGRVAVRARGVDARRFRVEVEDTGAGIAAADLGRLFVELEQLATGAGKSHAGTGLGLALVRRLTEALGGEVGVTSEVGVGSTFFVVLPREVPR